MGFETLGSLLLLLLSEDDEWTAVLVECKTHAGCYNRSMGFRVSQSVASHLLVSDLKGGI